MGMTSVPHPPLDDLVASHEAIDVTAPSFEAFYRREMPALILLARALSGSANADDAAQEAMLAAYRHWDEVQSFESPVGWVRRVCANKAVSSVRRRAAEARALLRLDPSPTGRQDHPDAVADFWAQVRLLPRRQAQAVALFYLYGLPVAEIAATLGCSVGSVKVHLSRGRATLAARLGESVEGDLS
jgi:RNA polymerase sigma-70 factor, ECF subfamily